jgi:hypothetical protein
MYGRKLTNTPVTIPNVAPNATRYDAHGIPTCKDAARSPCQQNFPAK